MAHSTRFAVLAFATLLLALVPAHAAPAAAAAAAAPRCALTGLAPKKPVVPPHRCPAAAELSCCADCVDTNQALQFVSSTLDDLGQMMNTWDLFGGTARVCDALQPYPQCMLMIERIICGATCNPDSGSYIVKTDLEIIMTLCPEFANAVFEACNDVEIQGGLIYQFYPDVQSLMDYVALYASNFAYLMTLEYQTFNITIAPGACFSGAAAAPTYTPCCDPLTVDPKCPRGAVDKVKYAHYINRTINSTACKAAAPQTTPLPTTATAPAPAAPAPAAPAPASPAPAPTARTLPASPNPTPATLLSPPPPPKSGAVSAASLMSVVALVVGAAAVIA